MLLVDTNVILDVVQDHPEWRNWSQEQLEAAAGRYTLIVNPVIYAELSIGYGRIEELESMLARGGFRLEPLPREALFLAGKAFLKYRRRGGGRTGVLPDFFIGAHAVVAGVPLLTRDTRRYKTYFPKLVLICPEAAA